MKKLMILFSLVIVVVLTRWIPHPPNFTPVLGLALFSGALFKEKWAVVLFSLLSIFLSDLLLGFSEITPVVYVSFLLITLMGPYLYNKKKVSYARVGALSVFSSILFFLITNFGVWALTSMYPKTQAGLMMSYVQAIPFFHNTLVSTFLFSFVLLAVWNFSQKHISVLTAEQKA